MKRLIMGARPHPRANFHIAFMESKQVQKTPESILNTISGVLSVLYSVLGKTPVYCLYASESKGIQGIQMLELERVANLSTSTPSMPLTPSTSVIAGSNTECEVDRAGVRFDLAVCSESCTHPL